MKKSVIYSSHNKKLKNSVIVRTLKTSVRHKISRKFQTDSGKFNIKLINDIIYNEKANIVGKFKDFLIYDDTSEFLKRYYKLKETNTRLPKIYDFYSSYSKIFPNYISISMAKYIYKNIQKKQKMIDKMQRNDQIEDTIDYDKREKIFNTNLYNSLMNLTIYSYHKNSMLNTTNKYFINADYSSESLEDIIGNINNAEELTQKNFFESKVHKNIIKNNSSNIIDDLKKNSFKSEFLPSSLKETVEEKTIEPASLIVHSHKTTMSIPKLPIQSINNNIYNNFNIINNFKCEFSPKTNSCRLEDKKKYDSNYNTKKRVSTFRKEVQVSSNQLINKRYTPEKKIHDKLFKENTNAATKSLSKIFSLSNPKTLKNTFSSKNLRMSSSINMNLKNLNFCQNDMSSMPQTARQNLVKDDSKELSKHVFSIKSNESTCNSKNFQHWNNKNSSMPKASNLLKKEVFSKINSERQNSNPKDMLLRRNNSEINKNLYNNKVMNIVNVSKSKFNSNHINLPQKKSTNIKKSINEIKKELVSPPQKINGGLIKPSQHTIVDNKRLSKNSSITSRKADFKSEVKGFKNIMDDKNSATKKICSSSRVKSNPYYLLKK